MSDTTKKAQPWDHFIKVVAHVASSMLMTTKGNLPASIITICFGEQLLNKFMHLAFVENSHPDVRYIRDKRKTVKFTDKEGATKGFGHTDHDKKLNEMALAWESVTSVIVEDGFLIYGGNVELRFNLFFKEHEKVAFKKGEEVHNLTLGGLNLFLNTWFAKQKDKEGKTINHVLSWTHVPAAEDFFVLSVKGLTPRQQYKAK